ncbi:hypothetical protein [Nocardia sp. NPDC060249]|uniref:hypothetical protein n=1 Tax=Nocardia sp. NPDC060249 TaxID=3347082 RepID=UPI003648073C
MSNTPEFSYRRGWAGVNWLEKAVFVFLGVIAVVDFATGEIGEGIGQLGFMWLFLIAVSWRAAARHLHAKYEAGRAATPPVNHTITINGNATDRIAAVLRESQRSNLRYRG